MTTTLKALLAALVGSIVALLLYLSATYLMVSAPTPAPSPSVVPSVLPSPSPSPSPIGIPVGAVGYQFKSVVTTTPSFVGARVGAYNDVLVPTTGTPDIIDALPPPRGFPFYAELQLTDIANGYGIPDDGPHLAQRGAIYQSFLKSMRDFGIEPIKQAITGYPMDWDQFKGTGASFRETTITGAIYPPCAYGPNPDTAPPVAFLQKVEAAILSGELPKGTWAYVWDEPTTAQRPTLIARLQAVRANAPHLLTMVTTVSAPDLVGLVDRFSPAFENWDGKSQMVYGSCMSQGTCTNGTPGIPTGTPMMVLDADPINWFVYPVVAAALGAQGALYYNETQSIKTALAPGGQYIFGGEGDGNGIYLGDNFTPWPSMRMLQIKRGLAFVNQQLASPDKGKAMFSALVQSPKVWNHTQAAYP